MPPELAKAPVSEASAAKLIIEKLQTLESTEQKQGCRSQVQLGPRFIIWVEMLLNTLSGWVLPVLRLSKDLAFQKALCTAASRWGKPWN